MIKISKTDLIAVEDRLQSISVPAKSIHVKSHKKASVRIATCPEREIILDVGVYEAGNENSCSVELTLAQARGVMLALENIITIVEKRKQT